MEEAEHKTYLMRLLDGLDVINREKRLKFARAILYLAQGKEQFSSITLFQELSLPLIMFCNINPVGKMTW